MENVKSEECLLSELLPYVIELGHCVDKNLELWARLEKDGYLINNQSFSNKIKLPKYRYVDGFHSDKNGYCPTNAPILKFELRNSINDLEKMSNYTSNIMFENKNKNNARDLFSNVYETHICINPQSVNGCLRKIRDDLHDQLLGLKQVVYENNIKDAISNPSIEKLELVFSKFHKISLELKERRKPDLPILMENEYDVQYILRGLLSLYFKLVKPEEACPSSGDTFKKIDFLLNNEKIALEIKRVKNQSGKLLQGQLLDDINGYRTHKQVNKIIFFLYDPEFEIRNRENFIDGIPRKIEDIEIKVYFSPNT